MTKNILIDAAYPEETRVAVECGGKLSEYDFITSTKQRNRGNIYLAKITRVEPSLQAAFVEYGEDKQGFLPFSEIHPDYYQIPAEDREKLMEEQQKALEASNKDDEEEVEAAEEVVEEAVDGDDDGMEAEEVDGESYEEEEFYVDESVDGDDTDEESDLSLEEDEEDEEKAKDSKPERFIPIHKRYKIQEVIKKNQIVLVQVSKEERGNKGATLSSYITIAGRYCVLMVNTLGGGGVSRKIAKAEDRKRLKGIIEGFNIPQSMSIIIRTAGNTRSEEDLRADYDYLVELWNSIREDALKAVAPALVHEESHIIKRSIRDLYDAEVDKIIVQGEDGYKVAKKFMKMLMPDSVKNVRAYKGKTPIFQHYKIEEQVAQMYVPEATLKSGGYLVIQPTEALISIDVNSGRSISARNIEETALTTNLEAVEEVARQLKLRNLSGLVVIDFIDMMNYRHRRAVEKAARAAFKSDRAKIQIGRISPFGLMEMSRQRIGANLVESTTIPCACCKGSGHTRSTESMALHLLRDIEASCSGHAGKVVVTANASPVVANYLHNIKRDKIVAMEEELNVTIVIEADASLKADEFEIQGAKGGKSKASRNNAKKAKPAKKPRRKPRTDQAEEGEGSTNAETPTAENETVTEEKEAKPTKKRAPRKSRAKSASKEESKENASTEAKEVAPKTEVTPKENATSAAPTRRKGIKSIRSWFASDKKEVE